MITLDAVYKSFGTTHAVSNISLTIKKGEVLGLLGPNGAGKTTTMRLISGFLYPDAGEITIDGVSMTKHPTIAQASIGYLPENNPLYSDMTVREFLHMSATLKGMSQAAYKTILGFIIPALGLENVFYTPIHQLSKGYKQRVGIATSLVHSPRVLILDEPTEGLDPNQRTEMRTLIKNLATEHTVIMSTHVMQEVTAVCNRIVIINQGAVVADGTQAELLSYRGELPTVIAELEGDKIMSTLKKSNAIQVLSSEKKNSKRVVCTLQSLNQKELVQPLLHRLSVKHDWTIWKLEPQQQNLESVFEQLTIPTQHSHTKHY